MSQAKVHREEIQEGGSNYSVVLIEAKNAYIVLLSEGEESLGTLAVSLPPKPGMVGPSLSSILLGDRNTALARALAERLANSMKRMILVSVFVKTLDDKKIMRIFLGLLEKILKNMGT